MPIYAAATGPILAVCASSQCYSREFSYDCFHLARTFAAGYNRCLLVLSALRRTRKGCFARPHTELAYSHTRRPAPWDKNQARADAYAFCATDSGSSGTAASCGNERRHSEHLCGRHKQTQFETHKAIRCETRAEAKKSSK